MTKLSTLLAASAAAGALALAGCGNSDGDMQALEAATGPDASRLFLEQMIVHHEGAVEMAQAQVDSGVNPDAIAMAQAIIDTQNSEIETMRDILLRL